MRRFIRRSPRTPIARRLAPAGALGLALALGACAVAPPTGPTVMALPGKGKSFATFRQEDASCRQYAEQQIGYMQPAQAANNAAVGSALIGTALGAAAGAAIGSVSGNMGAGAAIGGGAGLLGGSMVGANNADASAGDLQRRYNIAYTQCMYSNGDTVVARPAGYDYGGGGYGGYPAPAYPYPSPAYGPYYGPGYPPPGLSVGVGGGWYR
jgi:hypothetical protein